ncbi:hypothetical protein SBRCBS47491_004308 [Sporothrix bragantina]|uniref:Fe2OG dioxygenase domain-containing protein n=1 Tax=Sporothrix bragantina TaxID=671064 RepID=A0ABP0BMH8_9PEZI
MAESAYTRVQLMTLSGPEFRRVSTAPTRPATADEIPVIDLEGLWFYSDESTKTLNSRGTPQEAKARISSAIRKAATETGFFYVSHHGIPQSVVSNAYSQAKRFFEQPLDRKMRVHSRRDPLGNGYSPVYSGQINKSETRDLKEGFNFRYQVKHDPMHVSRHSVPDPNLAQGSDWIWEKTRYLGGFKDDTVSWWQGCLALSRGLVRLFALALDLEETYFDHITTHPGSDGLYICYPGTPETAPKKKDGDKNMDVGIGSHTDMQCFTLLWQDDNGGLEVLLPQRKTPGSYEWVGATPKRGTLVVNIADFLQRLSNDRFRSTVHRVYNRQSGPRYSMPFFFGFNYDAECAVVPTCVDETHPAKYAPISCGKWRDERMELARTVPRASRAPMAQQDPDSP